MSELTRSQVLSKAWPIILANIATPLLGLTDTAVIGNTGTAVDLGAIALGAVIFNFVYWTFGFLRMGTTGFVAQASGAGNELEIRLSLGRALILSGGIGLLLLTLQGPIALLMFPLLDASEAVSLEAKQYYFIRIWGAPAALTMYATMGLFIGLGMSRYLMVMQLLLNGLNIALDILLGGVLGWGVAGIAWGTVLSEWTVGLGGLLFALHILKVRQRSEVESADFWPKRRLFDPEKLLATLSQFNFDRLPVFTRCVDVFHIFG